MRSKLHVRYNACSDKHEVKDGKSWEECEYLDMSALDQIAGIIGFAVVDEDDVECDEEEGDVQI